MLVSRALSLLLSLVLPISIALDCLTFDGFTMGTHRLSAWMCALLELAGPCDCALRICVCVCVLLSFNSLAHAFCCLFSLSLTLTARLLVNRAGS